MSKNRRGHNEGSIYYDEQRKAYIGQFRYVDKTTGKKKRKKIIGKSKSEVSKKGKAFFDDLAKGLFDKKEVLTVAVWLDLWLETFVKSNVKIKTYERYECAVRQHIVPILGGVALNDLGVEQVQAMINALAKTGGVKKIGLAPRSVNSARRILSMALGMAQELGHLASNPVLRTKTIKEERPVIRVLSHEEGQKLIDTAKEVDLRTWIVIVLALGSGARIGEIMGLTWEHVDFNSKTITIARTVVSTSRGPVIQTTAKTKSSHRTIPLTNKVMEALVEYKNISVAAQEASGGKFIDRGGYIITADTGNVLDGGWFTDKPYKRVVRAAGLDSKLRFHDLRHTHATWLLDAGIPAKVVSERLGHSGIRITLDTYAHVQKGMQEKAVVALEEILG